MLVHRMTLFSFRLFRKNLGNLREFFGQMVHRPPWQKIARTPMLRPFITTSRRFKCVPQIWGVVKYSYIQAIVLSFVEQFPTMGLVSEGRKPFEVGEIFYLFVLEFSAGSNFEPLFPSIVSRKRRASLWKFPG